MGAGSGSSSAAAAKAEAEADSEAEAEVEAGQLGAAKTITHGKQLQCLSAFGVPVSEDVIFSERMNLSCSENPHAKDSLFAPSQPTIFHLG